MAIRVRSDELDRAGSGPRRLGASPHEAGRETAELYEAYGTLVYRYAWHMLRRREDAEDAAQATFLSVYAALSAGTAVLEPKAWVLRIVRNECLARLGRAGQAPSELDAVAEPASPAPSTEQQAELRSDVAAARRVLERLPAAQREAFVLREWLGLSTYEVAQACGTSVSAVDALLQRARRSLVQTVGASEGAVACDHARKALAADRVDRRTRAHILRCPSCRASRRRLGLPRPAIATAIVPAGIAARLSDLVPGFTAGGAVGAAAAGGGAGAALKLASLPVVWKAAAAGLALLTVTGGVAAVRDRGGSAAPPPRTPVRHAPAHGGVAAVGLAAAATGGRQVDGGGGARVASARGGRDAGDGEAAARGDGGRTESARGASASTDRGGDGSGERGRAGGGSSSAEHDGTAARSADTARAESDARSAPASTRERQASTSDRSGGDGSTADGGSNDPSGTGTAAGSGTDGGSGADATGSGSGGTSAGSSETSQPSSGGGTSSDPSEQP